MEITGSATIVRDLTTRVARKRRVAKNLGLLFLWGKPIFIPLVNARSSKRPKLNSVVYDSMAVLHMFGAMGEIK